MSVHRIPQKPHESAVEWLNSKAEILERFRKEREAEENAGARVADDCFCQGCGARGYRTLCPACRA